MELLANSRLMFPNTEGWNRKQYDKKKIKFRQALVLSIHKERKKK